ncbi:lysostaphin resistance A-like protein [Virgibacillus soli]|uniref:CPBP family intramembrane glutamic endopeptidase n=1 Tax=Paracerasibacillus soli TaxID=480284 RepID=UPI0035EECAD6
MSQSDIIKNLTDREIKKSLILSNGLFLFIALGVGLFLFSSWHQWFALFHWDLKDIVYYGVLPGVIIVLIDFVFMFVFDKRHYDDGGINERIFKSCRIPEIFLFTLMIASCEEVLFRGVIQSWFGFIPASIIFAFVHVRYLKKPLLIISIFFVSFYIGYLFELTGNLISVITAHFIVDFLLGLFIYFKK